MTCAGPETLSPRVLDVFVSIIPTLVEPSTTLSATSEFAFFVGSAFGTRDRRIPFGGNGSSGAWPCGFDDKKSSYQQQHLDSIQSTKPEMITFAGRSALEPCVSFSFAEIPTFLAPRTSLSATSESTFLVKGALRTHRSRCRASHGFRRGCGEQVTPTRR